MIVNRLSAILGERRMNVSEFARGAGISRGAAHALYHGTGHGIEFDLLNRVCTFLQVQPGDIFQWMPDEAEREGE